MSSRVVGSARKGLTTSLLVLVALALVPAIAQAGLVAGAGPTFPSTVTVGDPAVSATIEVRNDNTPPNSADPTTVCNFGAPSQYSGNASTSQTCWFPRSVG